MCGDGAGAKGVCPSHTLNYPGRVCKTSEVGDQGLRCSIVESEASKPGVEVKQDGVPPGVLIVIGKIEKRLGGSHKCVVEPFGSKVCNHRGR